MARILVIDDENNIRLMVRIALHAAGHAVETAADGTDGLAKFGDGSAWDVVLLDQRMPDIEGLDVLREIRRRDPAARVIMITAFGTVDLTTNVMQAGALDFLRKPFTTEVLRAAVQAAQESSGLRPNEIGREQEHQGFRATSINGFRIEADAAGAEVAAEQDGTFRCGFVVRGANDQAQSQAMVRCTVLLPAYFIELVKAHADREEVQDGRLFWQWLAEEALANYLWQHAQPPPEGLLRVEELTTGMKRWLDAVLTR